jgi:hypothetical protein
LANLLRNKCHGRVGPIIDNLYSSYGHIAFPFGLFLVSITSRVQLDSIHLTAWLIWLSFHSMVSTALQHPSKNAPARPAPGCSRGGQPHFPVTVIGANFLPSISSRPDRVNGSGLSNSRRARLLPIPTAIHPNVKVSLSIVGPTLSRLI